MPPRLITVAETDGFLRDIKNWLTDSEKEVLIDYLAANPLAGDLIPGTRGLRKLRWAAKGRGKRGGARVITFFHNQELPLYVLAAYAKNAKVDLTSEEKRSARALIERIVAAHKK